MEEFSFKSLTLVVFLAWLVPIVASRIKFIKVPSVILEILAGFIIGKSGLQLIVIEKSKHNNDHLSFLALIGFIMLMFLSGLETNLRQRFTKVPDKRSSTKFLSNPLYLGISIFLFSLLLSFLFSSSIKSIAGIQHTWYFTLILATTSVGIVMPTLKERGLLSDDYGQTIVFSAVVADILTIFLITITAIILKRGFNIEALIILAMIPGIYIAYAIGKYITGRNLFQKITNELSHASSQIKVRGTILLIMLFLVLSESIGAELILGAFFAGLVLSIFTYKERSTLILKLDGMGYGFFIPVFFIMVGVKFDIEALSKLGNTFFLMMLIVPAAFLIKIIPTFILAKQYDFPRRLAIGFLLSSRLSLIIAAAAIGLKLNLISPGMNSAIILLAWITCFASPIIFNKLVSGTTTESDRVIIIGAGKIGRSLGSRLLIHGKQPLVIEKNKENYQRSLNAGLSTFLMDGCEMKTYSKIKLSPPNTVVVVTGSDEKNIEIAKIIKNRFPDIHIIARDNNPETARILKGFGIVPMNLVMSAAITLENLIFRPGTYNALIESFDLYDVKEFDIRGSSFLKGKTVMNVPLPKDGFLLLVNKDGELKIPHGNTNLKVGDTLTVFGTITALSEMDKIFSV